MGRKMKERRVHLLKPSCAGTVTELDKVPLDDEERAASVPKKPLPDKAGECPVTDVKKVFAEGIVDDEESATSVSKIHVPNTANAGLKTEVKQEIDESPHEGVLRATPGTNQDPNDCMLSIIKQEIKEEPCDEQMYCSCEDGAKEAVASPPLDHLEASMAAPEPEKSITASPMEATTMGIVYCCTCKKTSKCIRCACGQKGGCNETCQSPLCRFKVGAEEPGSTTIPEDRGTSKVTVTYHMFEEQAATTYKGLYPATIQSTLTSAQSAAGPLTFGQQLDRSSASIVLPNMGVTGENPGIKQGTKGIVQEVQEQYCESDSGKQEVEHKVIQSNATGQIMAQQQSISNTKLPLNEETGQSKAHVAKDKDKEDAKATVDKKPYLTRGTKRLQTQTKEANNVSRVSGVLVDKKPRGVKRHAEVALECIAAGKKRCQRLKEVTTPKSTTRLQSSLIQRKKRPATRLQSKCIQRTEKHITHVNLESRSIRIGSLKGVPHEKVVVSHLGIHIKIEHKKEILDLSIGWDEIVTVLAHFGATIPVLFVCATPHCAVWVCTVCKMTTKHGPYFDPFSKEEPHRRITIFLDTITEQQILQIREICGQVQEISGCQLLKEVESDQAHIILVKSAPWFGTMMVMSSQTAKSGIAEAKSKVMSRKRSIPKLRSELVDTKRNKHRKVVQFSGTSSILDTSMVGHVSKAAADKSGWSTTQVEEAISFVNEIKTTYKESPGIFNRFLRLLRDFKLNKISLRTIEETPPQLFHNEPHLLERFNQFAPICPRRQSLEVEKPTWCGKLKDEITKKPDKSHQTAAPGSVEVEKPVKFGKLKDEITKNPDKSHQTAAARLIHVEKPTKFGKLKDEITKKPDKSHQTAAPRLIDVEKSTKFGKLKDELSKKPDKGHQTAVPKSVEEFDENEKALDAEVTKIKSRSLTTNTWIPLQLQRICKRIQGEIKEVDQMGYTSVTLVAKRDSVPTMLGFPSGVYLLGENEDEFPFLSKKLRPNEKPD